MEATPPPQRLSGMVPVARFFSEEDAAEFSRLAADSGVLAVVFDPKRLPAGFDGSLGGFDASGAYSVYASPDDIPKLCTALKESLTVDPHDPLCALSNAELHNILKTPLKGNLTEWALAEKLLATRGPEEDKVRTREEMDNWAQDGHAASDIRLARWLGTVVLASFGFGVVLAFLSATDGLIPGNGREGVFQVDFPDLEKERLSAPVIMDRFTHDLRVIIPLVLTLASSLVLTFSWRLLENDAWRWMFPGGWRAVGAWAMGCGLAGILLALLLKLFAH